MENLIETAKIIAANKLSGSLELAKLLLERLIQNSITTVEFESAMEIILKAHPYMAVMRRIRREISHIPSEDIPVKAKEFLESMKNAQKKIAEYFLSIVPDSLTFLTYSRSSTVFEVLKFIHENNRIKRIIISEGRPDYEGIEQARAFAKLGIPVDLTMDSSLGSFGEKADMFVVGADAITPGYIVNKIGTLPLALIANFENKPLYALASTHKFISETHKSKMIYPNKILADPPSGITPLSPVYEKVRISLFTGIIYEHGKAGIKEIHQLTK